MLESIEDLKAELFRRGQDQKQSLVNEVLERHEELKTVYRVSDLNKLLLEVNNEDELIHEVVARRLRGDPAPYLTGAECVDYLSNVEFDYENYKYIGSLDGNIEMLICLMKQCGMDKEADDLFEWKYGV